MDYEISNIIKKRQISNISSSSVPYDEHRFRSFMHREFYTMLAGRNTIQEKTIELEVPRENSDVIQEINSWGWGILDILNKFVNLEIVKEFYCNTKLTDEEPLESISWVGKRSLI